MKRKRIVIATPAALAVVSGATATSAAVLAAGPIDSAGVIHGCYYRATATGSHQVVLQDAAGTARPGAGPSRGTASGRRLRACCPAS